MSRTSSSARGASTPRPPRSSRSSQSSLSRRARRGPTALVLVACGALLGTVAACGSRGPLDADAPVDAGTDVAIVEVDAADAALPFDAGIVDAAPDREGGSIIGCGTCLVGQCSQGIIECVQAPACRDTLQCVVTECLAAGGAPSPACLFSCASGDVKGALKIYEIFQCVTGTCGTDCNPLLGGLLGGLGGGGGGGGPPPKGPPPKGPPPKKELPPFAAALSHWPEICSPMRETAHERASEVRLQAVDTPPEL